MYLKWALCALNELWCLQDIQIKNSFLQFVSLPILAIIRLRIRFSNVFLTKGLALHKSFQAQYFVSLKRMFVARKLRDTNVHQSFSARTFLGKKWFCDLQCCRKLITIWNHSFSTYANFSEKLTFLIPWYAHLRVRIRGSAGGKKF